MPLLYRIVEFEAKKNSSRLTCRVLTIVTLDGAVLERRLLRQPSSDLANSDFRLYDLAASHSWPTHFLSHKSPKAPGRYLPERSNHVRRATLFEYPDSPDRRANLEGVQFFNED